MRVLKKLWIRLLQLLAYNIPGATSTRIRIHRIRGVEIKKNVFIGQHVHIDNTAPHKVYIGNNTQLSMNVLIITHFRELGRDDNTKYSVYIDDDVFIGAGVIILPAVRIGKGSVIATGSVVTTSIPDHTFAIGNPAISKAKVGKALLAETSWAEFIKNMKPLKKAHALSKESTGKSESPGEVMNHEAHEGYEEKSTSYGFPLSRK
ncbi:MAG: acyltransferase [bacterium]